MMKEIDKLNVHFIKYYESINKEDVFHVIHFDLTYKNESDDIKHVPYLIAIVFFDSNKVTLAMLNVGEQKLSPARFDHVPPILKTKLLQIVSDYEKDFNMRSESLSYESREYIKPNSTPTPK